MALHSLDWKHEALDQLDWWWRVHLRPRLDGLTDDEYFWEPVPGCWTLHPRDEVRSKMAVGKGALVCDYEEPEPDPPPVTTIAWRLIHIAAPCLGERAENHFGEGWPAWDDIEWPATAAAALDYVDHWYARWLEGVQRLGDDGMARMVGDAEGPWAEHPYAGLVLHINREVIHHGAEVALLRDLYRARG
jgi:hypothetical protein